MTLRSWLTLATTVLVVLLVTEVGRRLVARECRRWPELRVVLRRCAVPAFVTALVAGIQIGLPPQAPQGRTDAPIRHALGIALIAAATWLAVQVAYAASDVALERVERTIATPDNRRARRVRTQLLLARRLVAAIAIVLASGAALMTFRNVRALGASVLASAGIAGIIGGVAAKPLLGNIFAGLQLAFSDALRIEDVVVIDDEWGRVEEITLTYVVVRTWDERRLILPTTRFVEQAFQNWTRHESRVIGSVYLRADWEVPVDDLRAELHRLLQESPLWDRREWVLQVTDVLPGGLLELRALMSAADAPSAWDLRCDVREKLVTWLRENHPRSMPRLRADLTPTERAVERWGERRAG